MVLALVAATGLLAVRAAEVETDTTSGNGQLTFSGVTTATMYRLEWSASASGPWTNAGAFAELDGIPATGTGAVTVTLPVRYRVIAAVTNGYAGAPAGMVLIPSGSNSGRNPLAAGESYTTYYPSNYSVTLASSLYMDRCEVTKGLWDEVAGWAVTNGYDIAPTNGCGKSPSHPVSYLTLFQCAKWCNARSERQGLTPCYLNNGVVFRTGTPSGMQFAGTATGYRLPTVTEWEYAARGGLQSRRFPWGDAITSDQACYHPYGLMGRQRTCPYELAPSDTYPAGYRDGTMVRTVPVGSYAANALGLHDMAGNVREWCEGWYARGGGWDDSAATLRCGAVWPSVESNGPSTAARYWNLGFRTVRKVSP
jgi:formylglycine-generating enzyme required for sulfatase activity